MERDSQFLKQKYGLHKSPEVESTARRTKSFTGHEVSSDPEARIQNYLDRFKQIFERTDSAHREQGVAAFKRFLHDRFVIKPPAVPESYFD